MFLPLQVACVFRFALPLLLLSVLAGCESGSGEAPRRTGSAAPPAGEPRAVSAQDADAPLPRYAHDAAGDVAALPDGILRGLGTDPRVLDCEQGVQNGASRFVRDWVGARRFDLDGDGRGEWIINGQHPCLREAGAAAWWIYAGGTDDADSGDGPRQLLDGVPARTLAVLPGRSKGFHDLRAGRLDGAARTLRYDGAGYVPASASAAQAGARPPASDDTLDTVAGQLAIVPLSDETLPWRFAVRLGDATLMTTGKGGAFADYPKPAVLRHLTQPLPPFDQVVVLQQHMYGNACNGGPLWMLGLDRDGSHDVSEPIDFCGGKAPVIELDDDRLVITLPGGPRNRGAGTLPTETWIYQDGEVRQAQPP